LVYFVIWQVQTMPVWQKEAVVIVKSRHIWSLLGLFFLLVFALFYMPTSVTSVSAQGQSANVPVWVNGELILPAGEVYEDYNSATRIASPKIVTRAGNKIIVYEVVSYSHPLGTWRREFAIKETPPLSWGLSRK